MIQDMAEGMDIQSDQAIDSADFSMIQFETTNVLKTLQDITPSTDFSQAVNEANFLPSTQQNTQTASPQTKNKNNASLGAAFIFALSNNDSFERTPYFKYDGLDLDPEQAETGNFSEHYEAIQSDSDNLVQESTHIQHGKLLDFIAEHESNGDYNIAYGGKHYDLTKMTINEVKDLQQDILEDGSPSSALGRYQIIAKTMNGLVDDMNLTGNELFDAEMQDRMAIKLLEGRGLNSYLAGRMEGGINQFANNISKEWASMPKDASGASYYDGDGLNTAHASYAALTQNIASMTSPTLASTGPIASPMG